MPPLDRESIWSKLTNPSQSITRWSKLWISRTTTTSWVSNAMPVKLMSNAPNENWHASIILTLASKLTPKHVLRNLAKLMRFSRTRKNVLPTTSWVRTGKLARTSSHRPTGAPGLNSVAAAITLATARPIAIFLKPCSATALDQRRPIASTPTLMHTVKITMPR